MDPVDPKSLLIVDDDEMITDLVAAMLEPDGYRCRMAASGREALSILEAHPTALVITDMRMPGMTGIQLLEQVRHHYPDTHVLLLTGAADVPMVVEAMRAGACDFMTKPFHQEVLRERVSTAVSRREADLARRSAEERRARSLSDLAARYRELSRGVLDALSTALETKHPETRAHSDRVATLSASLATFLGMSEDEVAAIYVAGLLHDIGKVAVDMTVLTKPDRLDNAEFDQIKSHPEESARIVAPIAMSPSTVLAIQHHHERYDGSGYPEGLRGEAIPLSARILAVCDAYDAMVSNRIYQAAVPREEAAQRLRSGAGGQWDGRIVEAFCANEELA